MTRRALEGRPGRVDVLLVDLAARPGGAEQRVVQLAGGLARCGLTAQVACLSGGALAATLRASGLPFVGVPYRRGDPRTALFLAQHLRRRGVRVVDAHNVQSQWWSVLAGWLARTPARVATVHSQYRWSEGGPVKGHAYEAVLRLAGRLGWRFIAVSDSVAEHLGRLGASDGAVRVVWSGVEAPSLPPGWCRQTTRRQLGLAEESLVLACVARLVPAKDHTLLLDAVQAVAQDLPLLRVVLVGDGPLRAAVEQGVRERGLTEVVTLLGHRDDVPAVLRAADVCVLTSRTEGLPYALLEAAAAGTPIVATDVGAIRTVFTDGVTARLVPAGDVARLRDALLEASRSPQRLAAMAQQARAVVEGAGLDEMLAGTVRSYGLDATRSSAEVAA